MTANMRYRADDRGSTKNASPASVAVAASTDSAQDRASALAERLGLPFVAPEAEGFDLLLTVHPDRLELRDTGPGGVGPVYADFVGGRRRYGKPGKAARRQPLCRAVDADRGGVTVVDATAGLGRDAFQLAALGCRVTAVERSPVVAALLEDGLRRARRVPLYVDIVGETLHVVVSDARDVLAGLKGSERPEVVYLDPMYPVDPKASALAKKEMRVLRRLVGDDQDAGGLLEVALATAQRRVVVKRMRHAPPPGPEPSLSYAGKIARYDVYLSNERAAGT